MQLDRRDAPLMLAAGAAICSPVSIAADQILMGLAFAALLIFRRPIKLPPFWPMFAAFAGWTILSLALSENPAGGLPQIKKLYVFLMPVIVISAITTMAQVRWIVWGWAAAGALSGAWSLVEFYEKYRDAKAGGVPLYEAYLGGRITGFMSHWMTFSGLQMITLLMVGALVLFAARRRERIWLMAAGTLIAATLALSFTRSMWLGAAAGGIYLLWYWRRWTILALPAIVGAILLANPFSLGERVISAFRPRADIDSNQAREIMRRTGWEMIRAKPWFGVGPEQVGPQFERYLPADIRRPLPPGYYAHLHNVYVHYAAERGIPALLALLAMLGKILYDFLRAVREFGPTSPQRWLILGCVASIIAVLAAGFYEVNLGDSEVLAMFLAVTGCGYAAASKRAPSP